MEAGLRSFCARRFDWLAATAFAIATLATRIPLRSHILNSGDSVNFALALDRYSIQDNSPHPPGYILYIALGRLIHLFIPNANTTYVLISILSAAAAGAIGYLVARDMLGRPVALVAGMLLLLSPMSWFYGEIALTYELELPLALLGVWFIYQLLFYRRYAVAGAIVLGLATGLRQDVLLFFGAFWLVGTLRLGARRMLLAWAALLVSVVAWMAPLASLAGGWGAWRQLTGNQFTNSVEPTSAFTAGLQGLGDNWRKLWDAAVWLLGPGVLMLAAGIAAVCVGISKKAAALTVRLDRRMLLVFLLPLPALLFFLLVHIGQPGYLMIAAGPLLLVAAGGIVWLGRLAGCGWSALIRRVRKPAAAAARTDVPAQLDGGGRPAASMPFFTPAAVIAAGLVTAAILFVNTGAFFMASRLDWNLPTADATLLIKYGKFSAGGIRRIDRERQQIIDTVYGFNPADTLVVAGNPFDNYFGDSRWLMYYLPDFRLVTLRLDMHRGFFDSFARSYSTSEGVDYQVPPGVRRVVFLSVPAPQIGSGSESLASLAEPDFYIPIYEMDFPASGRLKVAEFTLEQSGQ